MSAPQTSVSLNSPVGKVGMLADNSEVLDIVSASAAVDIPVGSYVELTYSAVDGKFIANRPVYGSSTLGKGGLVLLETAKVPSSSSAGTKGVHDAGTVFAVLRKGRMFALCDTAMTEVSSFLQAAKVKCASTTVTDQGTLTTAAASAVDNSEIVDTTAAGTPVRFIRPIDKANALCLVEVG